MNEGKNTQENPAKEAKIRRESTKSSSQDFATQATNIESKRAREALYSDGLNNIDSKPPRESGHKNFTRGDSHHTKKVQDSKDKTFHHFPQKQDGAQNQVNNQIRQNKFKNSHTKHKNWSENKPHRNQDTQKARQNNVRAQKTQDGVRVVENQHEKSNVYLHRDLRRSVEHNIKVQLESMDANSKLDLNTNANVRITPLGGLGEIGGNITVIETQHSAIIIDIGMSFPNENMHGVDILIPNFSYIYSIKDKIAGVIITHAHEDHIGAVPYFYKQFQFPLYGTPLPLGMIGNKFDEHGLKKLRSLFRIVEKRKPIQIGDFEIEWINITHSVIDASALAIRTNAGVILHTGDFKIDHTPIDGLPTDLHRLAHYGEEGVMLLMSDSTNSHRSGITPSESIVGPTFERLFADAKGRVIMSTFSSNIHRVYQAISYGIKQGRKVAIIGRSMEKNLQIAIELGYIKIPSNIFIEAHELEKYPDDEVLIITTGSQGESMSALYRMAINEHRHVKIKPDDLIIISAKAIPGNEGSVSAVQNLLMKSGAKVAYQEFSEIHVSGHASQEEQKLMLRLVKPKFFLPVHGEYNHIAKHKETAIKCGVNEKNIYLMEDGDQIEVNPNYIRKVRSVKNGKIFIDNQINRQIESDIVESRNLLANDGIVILSAKMNKERMILEHRISSYGLVANKETKVFEKEMLEQLNLIIKAHKKEVLNVKALELDIQNNIKKHIFKKVKKSPSIDVSIYLV